MRYPTLISQTEIQYKIRVHHNRVHNYDPVFYEDIIFRTSCTLVVQVRNVILTAIHILWQSSITSCSLTEPSFYYYFFRNTSKLFSCSILYRVLHLMLTDLLVIRLK